MCPWCGNPTDWNDDAHWLSAGMSYCVMHPSTCPWCCGEMTRDECRVNSEGCSEGEFTGGIRGEGPTA